MVYTATLGAFRWAQVKEETRDASPDTRERVVNGEKTLGFDNGFDNGNAQSAKFFYHANILQVLM